MLHQQGLKYSVATLGTALTPHHIRTLKRYTKNLVTVFDGDPGGHPARPSSGRLPLFFNEEAVEGDLLPKGEDPDGFLRKGKGSVFFESMIEKAVPLTDFFFDWMMKSHDMKSIENKVKVAKEEVWPSSAESRTDTKST